MSGSKSISIDERQVGSIYADAGWKLAVKEGIADEFLGEIEAIVAEVLDPNPDLETFFRLGSISQDRRQEMIQNIFSGKVSDLTYQFLISLNRHDRLGLLRAVAVCLRETADSSQGRVAVEVKTAIPLPDDQKERLATLLRGKLSAEPVITNVVEPDLVGGLWVRIGDRVYDRSVLRNLTQLRENILTRSSHEIQSGRDIVDRSTGN